MRNLSSISWGVLLIAVGILLGGNALDFWNIDIFFDGWWTLFIIVPCIINILRNGFHWGNVVGLLIGIGLLFSSWGLFPWHLIWRLFVPVVLVVLGLGILFNRGVKKTKDHGGYDKSQERMTAFCSSSESRVMNEEYQGGKISAVMGSAVLDLRNAVISNDIRIKADVFMGSVEIYFPPYVSLVVNSSPFLGSVENKTHQVAAINAPTVYLDCSAVMGGIELK